MSRIFGKQIHILLLALLCLSSGFSALAQESRTKPFESYTANKNFRFEVVSIRPVKPENSRGLNVNPTPNGFTSDMGIDQMIKAAYLPGYFEFPVSDDVLQETYVSMEWIGKIRLTVTPALLIFGPDHKILWENQGTLSWADVKYVSHITGAGAN